ncbi:MAG: peptidase M23 family protein [Parcubacteria group bacterium Gr01-1014_8]|nr:MAG: peptidase M23 family protein [Parcubacteria group bacterium Gr01-1014_8]
MLLAGTVLPSTVHASMLGILSEGAGKVGSFLISMTESMTQEKKAEALEQNIPNLQTLPLPKAAMNIDPNPSKGGGDVTVVDDSALLPDEGPSGTIADIVKTKNQSISIYVVQEGNTLSEIAEMFDVSMNTIKWANDISASGTIRVGQTLTILPVTGIKYKVKKGDTLASIAKVFHGDADEIANFNGIAASSLTLGDEIIIPDGELASAPRVATPKLSASGGSSAQYAGYYLRPIVGGIRSQGIHGYNGVDLAAPAGTPILASAPGDVIVSKGTGWNGGYGEYVVIKHDNGTQTLYAHASSLIIGVGQHVVQGQVIGYVGSTGRSTGAHVHFEIRGGPRNPF